KPFRPRSRRGPRSPELIFTQTQCLRCLLPWRRSSGRNTPLSVIVTAIRQAPPSGYTPASCCAASEPLALPSLRQRLSWNCRAAPTARIPPARTLKFLLEFSMSVHAPSAPASFAHRARHALPNLLAFSILAAVMYVGHHTGWKLPRRTELAGGAAPTAE